MDLEEWEIVPEDGSFQTHDVGGKLLFTRKNNTSISNSDFDMNYFVVNSSHKSQKPASQTEKQFVKADQETVSQEKQFVDMKIEYPKFSDISIYPRLDNNVSELPEKVEASKGETVESKTDSEKERENEENVVWEEKDEDKNIWKKNLSSAGIGAIFSFGVAVATLCVVILGSQGENKHRHNQQIRFQIFSDEKRIKQVVHNVVKLDEAFSSARDVLSKAYITTGGL